MFKIVCLFALCVVGYTYDELDLIDPTTREEDAHLDVEDFMNFDEIDNNPLSDVLRNRNFDPEEDQTLKAGKAEGDINLPRGVNLREFIANSQDVGRNAVRNRYMRWSSGEIPYAISSKYEGLGRKIIGKAMQVIHDITCIRFVPREHQYDYIYIAPIDGCFSHVGRQGGRQLVSLESGCFQVGTVIHELIHAIGFFHEQSRNDRDEYIEVNWNNIAGDNEDQFQKYSLYEIDHLDTEYHYGSLMHYDPYAFSVDRYRRKTITAKKPTNGQRLGQRDGPSDIDILRINRLYDCPDIATAGPTQPPAPTRVPCQDDKRLCPYWNQVGYCTFHENYMRQYCAKECGMCGQPDAPRPTAPPVIIPLVSGRACKDYNGNCKKWNRKGYCQKYDSYMLDKCPKTCGQCEAEDVVQEVVTVLTKIVKRLS